MAETKEPETLRELLATQVTAIQPLETCLAVLKAAEIYDLRRTHRPQWIALVSFIADRADAVCAMVLPAEGNELSSDCGWWPNCGLAEAAEGIADEEEDEEDAEMFGDADLHQMAMVADCYDLLRARLR